MKNYLARNASGHAAVFGAALVVMSLAIIWAARIVLSRSVYVSELGAKEEPTAGWFEGALLLLVAGGYCVTWASRHLRSRAPLIRSWSPSVSLAIASSLFLVASQVPCTKGCPLPVGPSFTWQDLIHTTVAVLAFGMAAVAMLQVSFLDRHARLRRISLVCCGLVATVAAAGGLMSLTRFHTELGSVFEFVATTIGIGWLALLGVAVAYSPPVRE